MTAPDPRLDEIQARFRDCLTYNFGMRNADKLAHEDVPFLLAELRKAHEALTRVEGVHEPIEALMYSGPQQRLVKVCTGCGTDDGNWQRWPCPTIKALEVTQ